MAHGRALQKFLATPTEDVIPKRGGETYPDCARTKLLDSVRSAAKRVPAYGQFLSERGIEADQVQSSELGQIPIVNKENYFRQYSISDRCWDGNLSGADFMHCSSGSSGTPQLWPRNAQDEITIAAWFEMIFDSFGAKEKSTFAVICLPLGSWVGGIFTIKCISYLSLKGFKITMVTPGNKPDEILQLSRDLAPLYDQTVLIGYPPFVKGVVDKGLAQSIPWPNFDIKLILAGEVFSEEWRSLMSIRCGIDKPKRSIVSIYGTADAGVIGGETELSATLRGWFAQNPKWALEMFGKERLPTLCQYSPDIRYMDIDPSDGTLVVSGLGEYEGAAPLLRYGIGDNGGLLSYDQMLKFVEERGFDLGSVAGQNKKLPFVWVFGRSFWAVSVYGANVYVENIMVGLEQEEMQAITTGKFVLFTEDDSDLNKGLAIRVELIPGKELEEGLDAEIGECVKKQLLRLNSEYANYVPEERQLPRVYLYKFGSPDYFPVGVKHKYIL
ncbi:hypothetical protein BSKO_13738 [Bryopsis sp. KO-2023]|nr:hypothetical protein BSKO_13738 [Bryopsis sp. KO-2023]